MEPCSRRSSLIIVIQIEQRSARECQKVTAYPRRHSSIGSFDPGMKIGHPIRDLDNYDQELVDAVKGINEAALAPGKVMGISCDTAEGREYAKRNVQMISDMINMVGQRNVFRLGRIKK
ncbi:hypothetical protein BJX63DRAFT_413981 [Aspergillus granulosus]|uniref:Uncharacterized protein n=1 Tax=Aspergillus granulosus TaxID=176169 RepID=A0ABR4GUP8_9EURO